MDNENFKKTTINFPRDLYEKLALIANKGKKSFNQAVNKLVKQMMKKEKKANFCQIFEFKGKVCEK